MTDERTARLTDAIKSTLRAAFDAARILALCLILILAQAARTLFTIAPGLARMAIIGAAIWSAWWTFPRILAAYGGDIGAGILALLAIGMPFAFGLAVARDVAGVLLGACAILALGATVPVLPIEARSMTLPALVLAAFMYFKNKEGGKPGEQTEGNW